MLHIGGEQSSENQALLKTMNRG